MFRLDRDRLPLADWLVVAVAIALPWSTSATQIFGVAWLLAVVPTVSIAAVRRELTTAAGGLPVLLWCLGTLGMLWAHVSWAERFAGLNSFNRLLIIPLLLAQFRRSDHGRWAVWGFLVSSIVALVASFILILFHSAGWRGNGVGVAAHDDVFQSSLFLICAFALLGAAWSAGCKRHWTGMLLFAVAAALFLANFAFVELFSRITLAVAPVLAGLLGWRWSRWQGLLAACALLAILGSGLWFASPSFRLHLHNSGDEIREYLAKNKATSIGMHTTFLTESFAIVAFAPITGHGTGSIPDEFRRITAHGTAAAGVATDNPHNQTLVIAIQLGAVGVILLWAMWIAHLLLFRSTEVVAWIGTVIVVENIISSTVHSHLFDFANGWLYIFGVGVLGGMTLRRRIESSKETTDAHQDTASAEHALLSQHSRMSGTG